MEGHAVRICDVCLTPAPVSGIEVKHGFRTAPGGFDESSIGLPTNLLWNNAARADLCKECLELIRNKQWIAIGKKHETALTRFMHLKETPDDPLLHE
jgi:hypothetical protein